MEIILNEVSFTALLGSVILFTLTCANLIKGRGGGGGSDPAPVSREDKEEKENKVSSSRGGGLKYRRASSAPTQRKVGRSVGWAEQKNDGGMMGKEE